MPPRGPVQNVPLRQSQAVAGPFGSTINPCGFASGPEQNFFDPLIEPSLQTNFPPAQCAMPPLPPEHGVLAAKAEIAVLSVKTRTRRRNMFMVIY